MQRALAASRETRVVIESTNEHRNNEILASFQDSLDLPDCPEHKAQQV